MAKKVVRWLMIIVFYAIYFLLFKHIIATNLPLAFIWDLFSLLVLTVINIPLSVASTVKVFSIIENGEKS